MEILDIGIYACYILLFIAAVSAIGFPIIQVVRNPKALVKSGIGVGSLVVLFIITYSISGSEVTPKYMSMGVAETGSKLIGAGLSMFYITLIIAFALMVYSEINKAIK